MAYDLQITVGKWEVKEAREELKKYSIIERVTTRTARGKHGVTYPNSRDISIYFFPFWKLPKTDEVNRQMSEIQGIPMLIRQRHPEYRDMVY